MITSVQNQQIKLIQALNSKKKERDKHKLFVAEGVKIFREIPDELRYAVFVSESCERENGQLLNGVGYECVEDHLFERISDTRTPQGIITLVKQPAYSRDDLLGDKKPFILLLEDIQDPGNVGTIIRTAEGAGVTGIILTKGCADLTSPKTIRSTMGSIFRIPFVYEDANDAVSWLKENDITSYGAHLAGKCSYIEPDYTSGTAIFIGNEGNGLSEEITEKCDMLVTIPMEGKLESLNAAVAAAIFMYKVHEKRN